MFLNYHLKVKCIINWLKDGSLSLAVEFLKRYVTFLRPSARFIPNNQINSSCH